MTAIDFPKYLESDTETAPEFIFSSSGEKRISVQVLGAFTIMVSGAAKEFREREPLRGRTAHRGAARQMSIRYAAWKQTLESGGLR